MPRVTVEDTFAVEIQHSQVLNREFKEAVFGVVLAASVKARANIKAAMPVDTGAARARWGIAGGPGIWIEDRNALAVEQGAALEPYEYIKRLNEGYSHQAPAGFLDVEAERAADEVADGALNVLTRDWED